jgi:heme/copper-type cytochrome/quinol oxidase subunit 4
LFCPTEDWGWPTVDYPALRYCVSCWGWLLAYVLGLFFTVLLCVWTVLGSGWKVTVSATHVTLGFHVHTNTVILVFMFLQGLKMTSWKSKHVADYGIIYSIYILGIYTSIIVLLKHKRDVSPENYRLQCILTRAITEDFAFKYCRMPKSWRALYAESNCL